MRFGELRERTLAAVECDRAIDSSAQVVAERRAVPVPGQELEPAPVCHDDVLRLDLGIAAEGTWDGMEAGCHWVDLVLVRRRSSHLSENSMPSTHVATGRSFSAR